MLIMQFSMLLLHCNSSTVICLEVIHNNLFVSLSIHWYWRGDNFFHSTGETGLRFFRRPCNIYREMILRNIEQHEGIKVGDYNINHLRYANDTVLITDSEEKPQVIIITVTKENENKDFQLNATKTECMVISKRANTPVCNVSCKG